MNYCYCLTYKEFSLQGYEVIGVFMRNWDLADEFGPWFVRYGYDYHVGLRLSRAESGMERLLADLRNRRSGPGRRPGAGAPRRGA